MQCNNIPHKKADAKTKSSFQNGQTNRKHKPEYKFMANKLRFNVWSFTRWKN